MNVRNAHSALAFFCHYNLAPRMCKNYPTHLKGTKLTLIKEHFYFRFQLSSCFRSFRMVRSYCIGRLNLIFPRGLNLGYSQWQRTLDCSAIMKSKFDNNYLLNQLRLIFRSNLEVL